MTPQTTPQLLSLPVVSDGPVESIELTRAAQAPLADRHLLRKRGMDNSSRVTTVSQGHAQSAGREEAQAETIIEGEDNGRGSYLRARAGWSCASATGSLREQTELEVSRWLVALVALGAVGVLLGFWALAAWGLYTLFV